MTTKHVAAVFIRAADGGFALEFENEDLPPETLAELLRAAADTLEGKDDRASGCWGR